MSNRRSFLKQLLATTAVPLLPAIGAPLYIAPVKMFFLELTREHMEATPLGLKVPYTDFEFVHEYWINKRRLCFPISTQFYGMLTQVKIFTIYVNRSPRPKFKLYTIPLTHHTFVDRHDVVNIAAGSLRMHEGTAHIV